MNGAQAAAYQSFLTARCSFPLFQDVADVDAVALSGGRLDDFFVYDRSGRLSAHLPIVGGATTDLTTAEGRRNVRRAIVAAFERP